MDVVAEVVPDVVAQVMVMAEQEPSRDEDETGERDGDEYESRAPPQMSLRLWESPPSP